MTRDWLGNKLSTPGTSVEMREIEREKRDGELFVHYHVFAKGAPQDQLYQVLQWPINAEKPFATLSGLSIGSNGLVICAGRSPGQCRGEKEDDDVDFTVHPAKGEPFRLALVSADERTKIYFGVVPDPIIGKDKGCRLEVVLLLPKSPLVILRASGYTPNEELQFAGKSYDEAHEARVKADSSGEYMSALLPNVEGKSTGTTRVTLTGANCAPKLSFDWGK